MKGQAFNPYLPSWEYIPDGEPHVFGGRVYVYGSHDKFNAPIFCVKFPFDPGVLVDDGPIPGSIPPPLLSSPASRS